MAVMASKAVAATVSLDLAAPSLSFRHQINLARPSRYSAAAACSLWTRSWHRASSAVVVASAATAAAPAKEVLVQPGDLRRHQAVRVEVNLEPDPPALCPRRVVDNLLNSEDVHYMLEALKALGLHVEADKAVKRAVVVGGNAIYVLDGVPRMRERPIGDLVVGLK